MSENISSVNHPYHYNIPGKKECIEQMREDFGDNYVAIFCLTNSYKYLYRAGEKKGNSKEQDLSKARWYVKYVEDKLQHVLDSDKFIKSVYMFVKDKFKE